MISSAPYLTPSLTVFENRVTASSKSRSPYGRKSFPEGPISRATNFSCGALLSSFAAFAFAIAREIIFSSSSSVNFKEFAPNVLAEITLLPASK